MSVDLDLKVARKYIALEQSAKERGLEFSLTIVGLRNLLAAKYCYYTGVEFTKNGGSSRSIDRVDSSKGYITGNVVACCSRVNQAKADLSLKEIKAMVKKMEKKCGKDPH